MVYSVLAAIIVVIAFFVLFIAGRLLLKNSWFMGWVRGTIGICLLLSATILAFVALDLYSYKQLNSEQSIASLSFSKSGPQEFEVSLVDNSGAELIHKLNGDLWQLDARILKWNRGFSIVGLKTGYRLDRLSGRYYSLAQEKSSKRTVYELGQSDSSLDVWNFLKQYGRNVGIVDASYGSATYLPMVDGALFSVFLSNTGLLARPLNDRAKDAVAGWE